MQASSKQLSSFILPYSGARWWLRPRAHDRPPLYWHIASRAFALMILIMPRRYRFRAAVALARALTPLIRRTPWYDKQRKLRLDGVSEIALHHMLNIMSNSGAQFDMKLTVEGAEQMKAAIDEGKGVLLVAPHALLSICVFRYLHDIGCAPTIISLAPLVHIYGTGLAVRAIQPSALSMINLRSRLRSGGVVCAMIDQQPPNASRTIEFATSEGAVRVSDALIRLAERCRARVVFTAARADKHRGVILTFGAPKAIAGMNAETITEDFVEFLKEHIATVAASSNGSPSS